VAEWQAVDADMSAVGAGLGAVRDDGRNAGHDSVQGRGERQRRIAICLRRPQSSAAPDRQEAGEERPGRTEKPQLARGRRG